MSKIIYPIYNHSNFSWELYILSAYVRRNYFRTFRDLLPADYPKNGLAGLVLREGKSTVMIPMAKSTTTSEALYLAKKYQVILFEEINQSLYGDYFALLERKLELVLEGAPYFLEWLAKFQSRYADTIDPQAVLNEMRYYSVENFHTFVRDNFCTAPAKYIAD